MNSEELSVNRWSKYVLTPMLAVSLGAVAGALEDQIVERIKPVGQVCVEGEACGTATAAAGAAAAGPRSGEAVYNGACMACHASGAGGAPKVGDVGAWTERIAQGSDVLHQHALNGIRGMPAKGLCMNCSEDEVKAAVDYMVEKSR